MSHSDAMDVVPPFSTQDSNCGMNVVAQSLSVTLAEKVCRKLSGPPCTTKCLQPAVAATYLRDTRMMTSYNRATAVMTSYNRAACSQHTFYRRGSTRWGYRRPPVTVEGRSNFESSNSTKCRWGIDSIFVSGTEYHCLAVPSQTVLQRLRSIQGTLRTSRRYDPMPVKRKYTTIASYRIQRGLCEARTSA